MAVARRDGLICLSKYYLIFFGLFEICGQQGGKGRVKRPGVAWAELDACATTDAPVGLCLVFARFVARHGSCGTHCRATSAVVALSGYGFRARAACIAFGVPAHL